jgi:hypothetical protein
MSTKGFLKVTLNFAINFAINLPYSKGVQGCWPSFLGVINSKLDGGNIKVTNKYLILVSNV